MAATAKQQQKKRSIHFTNTLKDQKSAVRAPPSGKKSAITKEQTETMQIKEGEKVSREQKHLWEGPRAEAGGAEGQCWKARVL